MQDTEIIGIFVFGAVVVLLVLLLKKSLRRAAPTAQPPPAFDAHHGQKLAKPKTIKGRAYIVDGDTVKLGNTQIRLFGIDAPELDHPYGIKAKWALHKLCKGCEITAVITDIDHYGRTVAACYLPDGKDLSAEMVKLGLALDWPKFSKGIYAQFETVDARQRLFLADARMNGNMHVWRRYEARKQEKR